MAVSEEALREAVQAIARVEGLSMDENDLVEDVFLLAYAFPGEDDFKAAAASTCQALSFLVAGKVSTSNLKYEFGEWHSYHYQHRAGQGIRALCRIMFKEANGGIEVKGFGHRRIPEDFYRRMGAGRP